VEPGRAHAAGLRMPRHCRRVMRAHRAGALFGFACPQLWGQQRTRLGTCSRGLPHACLCRPRGADGVRACAGARGCAKKARQGRRNAEQVGRLCALPPQCSGIAPQAQLHSGYCAAMISPCRKHAAPASAAVRDGAARTARCAAKLAGGAKPGAAPCAHADSARIQPVLGLSDRCVAGDQPFVALARRIALLGSKQPYLHTCAFPALLD